MASETDPATVKRRSKAAERQRALRARRREGFVVIPLEVHIDEINALIDAGFLAPNDRNSLNAQMQAFYRFFQVHLQ